MKHGYGRYTNGCRCDVCRTASGPHAGALPEATSQMLLKRAASMSSDLPVWQQAEEPDLQTRLRLVLGPHGWADIGPIFAAEVARVRADVAEEIARAIEAMKPSVRQFWDSLDARTVYVLNDAAKKAREVGGAPAESVVAAPPPADAQSDAPTSVAEESRRLERVAGHAMTVDPILDIRVYGAPAPQGSKRAFRNEHTGRIQQVESSAKVKPWREGVTAAALAAGADTRPLYDGEVIASMVFTFVRPKSHYRTGRNAHLLRDSAPARPHGKPDLSKLLRSTEDALTGVVWTDDARIVEYGRAAKVWASEDPDALDRPGAVITVWPARSDAVLSGQLGDTGRPPDLFDTPPTDWWAGITPAKAPSTEESP